MLLITVLSFGVPAWAADGADLRPEQAAVPARGVPLRQEPGGAPEDDTDLDIDPLQPDFTLITLPTTLRMPRMEERVPRHAPVHALLWGRVTSADLAEDFFGIDSGAAIGLEYRFGLMRGTDVGIRRTNDRTIEFQTEHNILQAAQLRRPWA